MMFRFFILMLFATTAIGCDNDIPISEIPSVVENTFESHFPNAMDVEWESNGDYFEVDFDLKQTEYSAQIDNTGNMKWYKYEISNDLLPPSILSVLETEYSKKKWEDPEILVSGENSFYKLEIDGFFNDKKIMLDSTGNKIENIKNWN